MNFDPRWAAILLFVPLVARGEKGVLHTVYCVPGNAGAWYVEAFHPLIDPAANSRFAEVWTVDRRIERLLLRSFHNNREVRFEYRFSANGKLLFLTGSVDLWRSWIMEATLPDTQRRSDTFGDVHFYRTRNQLGELKDRIPVPEGAGRYLEDLTSAPVYLSASEIPSADQLKAVESMNATQK